MMNAMYTEDEHMTMSSAVFISHMVSVILPEWQEHGIQQTSWKQTHNGENLYLVGSLLAVAYQVA